MKGTLRKTRNGLPITSRLHRQPRSPFNIVLHYCIKHEPDSHAPATPRHGEPLSCHSRVIQTPASSGQSRQALGLATLQIVPTSQHAPCVPSVICLPLGMQHRIPFVPTWLPSATSLLPQSPDELAQHLRSHDDGVSGQTQLHD